jgi:hypothetical protein
MDCWHSDVVEEGEFLHCERLVEVLALDVLPDVLVGDGLTVLIGCAEEHTGSVVVLIVHDIHFVVPEVFFILFLNLSLSSL